MRSLTIYLGIQNLGSDTKCNKPNSSGSEFFAKMLKPKPIETQVGNLISCK